MKEQMEDTTPQSKKTDKSPDISEDFVEITESGGNNSNSDEKAKSEDAAKVKRQNSSEERLDIIERGAYKNVIDLTPSKRRCYSKEDGDSYNLKARPVKVIYCKQNSGSIKQPLFSVKFKIHSRPRAKVYNMLKPRTYGLAEDDSDGDERLDDGYLSKVCEEYREIDQNIINLTRSSSIILENAVDVLGKDNDQYCQRNSSLNLQENNGEIHYLKRNKKYHQANHDLLKDKLRKEFPSCEVCNNYEIKEKNSILSISSDNINSDALVEYPSSRNSKNHRRKRRHPSRITAFKTPNNELEKQNIESNSNCGIKNSSKEINVNEKFQKELIEIENDFICSSLIEESQDTNQNLSTKTFKKYSKINIKKVEHKELMNKAENKDRKFCSEDCINEEKAFANNAWETEESKRFKSAANVILDYNRRGDVYGYEYFKIYCSKDDSGDSSKRNRSYEFTEIENPVNLNQLKQCVDKSLKGRLHNNFAQFVEKKFRENKKIIRPVYDSEREDYERKPLSVSKFSNETTVKDEEVNTYFFYDDKKKMEDLESRRLWGDVKDDLKYEIRKMDNDKAEALIKKEIVGRKNDSKCSYECAKNKYAHNRKKRNNRKKCKLHTNKDFETQVFKPPTRQCGKLNKIKKDQDNSIKNLNISNYKKIIEKTITGNDIRNSSIETSKNYASQWKTTGKGYNSTKENQINDIYVRLVDFHRYQKTDGGQAPWYFFKHIESNCSKKWEQLEPRIYRK